MRHVYALTLFGTSLMALAACAPKLGFKAINPTNTGGYNGELITGGIDDKGTSFTSFSPERDVHDIRKEISVSDENIHLAENIVSVTTNMTDSSLEIFVHWKGLKEPLKFVAPVEPNTTSLDVDNLSDKSAQMPSLKLRASCETAACAMVRGTILDGSGSKAGFIVRKEERTLRLRIPDSQKKKIDLLSPAEKQKIQEQEQGKPVVVTSTEVFPGKSSFEITSLDKSSNGNNAPSGLITGDLLDTSEGAKEIQAQGDFSDLGTGELIGNSNDGELVFRFSHDLTAKKQDKPAPTPQSNLTTERLLPLEKFTNLRQIPIKKNTPPQTAETTGPTSPTNKMVSYLVLEPRTQNVSEASNPSNTDSKTVDVQGKNIHPLVKQILADGQRDEVKKFIAQHVVVKTMTSRNGQKQLKISDFYQKTKVYIACHVGDNKTCGVDSRGAQKSQSAQKMTQILAQQNLPAAISMVSLIESFYEPSVKSSVGALGWWQFMPDTATGMGLRVDRRNHIDERQDLVKSTNAAARYLKDLLVAWKGDLKMALASYNRGEGAMRRSCIQRIQTELCHSGQTKGLKFEEMRDLLEISNNDFWKFYKHNYIPVETQNYVLQFISGNLVAHSPRDYGMDYEAMNLN